MSLYKVYETQKLEYRLQPPQGWQFYSYNDVTLAGDYMETVVRGASWVQMVWGARGSLHETLNSHSVVYALYAVDTVNWPSWGLHIAAFDGQTGARIWTDYYVEGANNIGMLLTDIFWQDTDGRIWGHSKYGRSIRYRLRTDDALLKATASGMPDFLEADLAIDDVFWTDEVGGTISSHQQPMAILPRANRAILSDGYHIRIHDYTTGFQLHKIPTSYGISSGIAVDARIFYGVTENGLINVIDYKEGIHKGFLSLGEGVKSPKWSVIGFDPVYRRILTCVARADEPVTLACNVFIEGSRLSVLPEFLVKPIPLAAPKKGRVVPVYSRVVGSAALGVGGIEVQASLTGPNGISPNRSMTDSSGEVRFLWDCDVDGTDIDTIQLQAEYEGATEGIDPPDFPPVIGILPTSVLSASVYHPGWWISINRNYSGATLSSIFAGYLDVYDSNEEIPITGVRLDYSWAVLDITQGGDCPAVIVDTAQLEADILYLEGFGLRVIVNFESATPYAPLPIKPTPPGAAVACPILYGSDQCGCVWPCPEDCLGYYSVHKEDYRPLEFGDCCDVRNYSRYYPSYEDYDNKARFKSFFNAIHAAIGQSPMLDGYGFGRLYPIGATHGGEINYIRARGELSDYVEDLTGKMAWEFVDHHTDYAMYVTMDQGHNSGIENIRMADNMVYNNHETGPGQPDKVAFSYRADLAAWTTVDNLTCNGGGQATALQMVFGDIALEDCFKTFADQKRPHFFFWEWDESKWEGTDMIKEVCENYSLSKARQYYGV